MKNFISKIADAMKLKSKPVMRGDFKITKTGKLDLSPTARKMNRQLRAPTDVGELSGYLKQHHNKEALVLALRRVGMPINRKNLKVAAKALSMQAMAKTRDMKNPRFGFDTSLKTAFKNASRRV